MPDSPSTQLGNGFHRSPWKELLLPLTPHPGPPCAPPDSRHSVQHALPLGHLGPARRPQHDVVGQAAERHQVQPKHEAAGLAHRAGPGGWVAAQGAAGERPHLHT